MSDYLKKSSSCFAKCSSIKQSATKPKKEVTFSNFTHEIVYNDSSDSSSVIKKKSEPEPSIKGILKPIVIGKNVKFPNSNLKPNHVSLINESPVKNLTVTDTQRKPIESITTRLSNSNLKQEKLMCASKSSVSNLTIDAQSKQTEKKNIRLPTSNVRNERHFFASKPCFGLFTKDKPSTQVKPKPKPTVCQIRKGSSHSLDSIQSSVSIARKRYAYLSQCNVLSNLNQRKPSARNNVKGYFDACVNPDRDFDCNTSRLSESLKLEIGAKVKHLRASLIKNSELLTANIKPFTSQYVLDSYSTGILTRPETSNELNAQELYKNRFPHPKGKIQLLCSKCKFISYHQPRPNMPLLVLDLDETLCDFVNEISENSRARRPHLDYFLQSVYEYYDIAIWSATKMDLLQLKLNVLKLIDNPDLPFKISFCLDVSSTLKVQIPGLTRCISKPLIVIWDLFEQYHPENTLIVDDKRSNFHFNPQQGLKISPYRKQDYDFDNELLPLMQYLCEIAYLKEDFLQLNHNLWKSSFNKILR